MADKPKYSVIDRDLTAPPASPTEGDRYIMPVGTLTGDWAAFSAHSFAVYVDSDGEETLAWEEQLPEVGEQAFVEDEELLIEWRGTPDNWVDVIAWRERLTADRTYYVRAAGSSTNDGLTVATALNSINQAIDRAALLDTDGFNVTIDFDEIRVHTFQINLKRLFGGGIGILSGKNDTESHINVTGNAIDARGRITSFAGDVYFGVGEWIIQFCKIEGSDNGLIVEGNSNIHIGTSVRFAGSGTPGGAQIDISPGAIVLIDASYTIDGDPYYHLRMSGGRIQQINPEAIVVANTPAWGGVMLFLRRAAVAIFSGFDGTATGTRFSLLENSILVVGGTAIPGSVAGTVQPGSYYNDLVSDLRATRGVRDNLSATADPVVTDDAAFGFGVGSLWMATVDGVKRNWRCIDATAGAAKWEKDAHAHPGFTAGDYAAPIGSNSLTTNRTLLTTAQLVCWPFYFRHQTEIDRVGVYLQTNGEAGAELRLGLYTNNRFGRPDTRIGAGLGTIALDAGAAALKEITGLSRWCVGWVWLVIWIKNVTTTAAQMKGPAAAQSGNYVGQVSTYFTDTGTSAWLYQVVAYPASVPANMSAYAPAPTNILTVPGAILRVNAVR